MHMNVMPDSYRAKKLAIHIGGDASRRVSDMLALQSTNMHAASQQDFPLGSIGCLGGSLPASGNVCLFSGVPINGPDVKEIIDADSATRLFPTYDGAFVGVFWDVKREILVVVTDCLGMQPLYMRHDDSDLTLVSETKALRGNPDLAAWGAFISMGHPIGNRSLMQDLVRVPPASVLTFDCRRRRLDIHRYWQWPDASDAWRGYDYLSSLEQDVRAYAAYGDPGTLLLSGGFDSRLLLFLIKRAGIPIHALIVAHEDEFGDADGRLAESVISLANIPFRKAYPPKDFFSSNAYLEYLHASDAGFPSLDLFIAKVASQLTGTAVWDGLVPGFAFSPLHQPKGGFEEYLRQEVLGPDSKIWRAAKLLFKHEVCEAMQTGFGRDLHAEMSRLPRDFYGLTRFVIEHRSRNRTSMNPLKVYANHGDVYTPGITKEFMTHAAIIPYAEKLHCRFHRRLLKKLDKRSLKVPFISGGELMKGRRFSPAFSRERIRNAYYIQRSRHPRFFPGSPSHASMRSTFLGKHLLEGDDMWLRPDVRECLNKLVPENYLAWRLLFHWKAWQWTHMNHLKLKLNPHA